MRSGYLMICMSVRLDICSIIMTAMDLVGSKVTVRLGVITPDHTGPAESTIPKPI